MLNSGDTGPRREIGGHCGVEEMFDGGIGQGEFIKGMVWSQILGPRGGIQASKRFRYNEFPGDTVILQLKKVAKMKFICPLIVSSHVVYRDD